MSVLGYNFESTLSEVAEILELYDIDINDYINFEIATPSADISTESIVDFKSQIEETKKQALALTETLEKTASNLSKAYQDLENNGSIQQSTMNKLLKQYPELFDCYDAENNTLNITREILDSIYQKEKETSLSNINNIREEIKEQLKLQRAKLAAAEASIPTGLETAKLREETIESTKAIISELTSSLNFSEAFISSQSPFEAERKAIENDFKSRVTTAKEYYDELEKLRRKYYDDGTAMSNSIAEQNRKLYSDAIIKETDEKIRAINLY